MKYCTMCGAALEDEAVFCSVCGTKQATQQNVQQVQIPQQPVPQNIQQEQMPQQQVAQNYQSYPQQAYFQQNQMLQQPSAQNYQPYPQQPVQNYQPYPQQPYFQSNQMSQQQVAQQNMQQGQMPQQPFIAQAQSMQAPTLQEQTNQSLPTQNTTEQNTNGGKKKKKLIIASIAAVLVIGLGIGAYFLFFKKKSESRVEVLDKYFEALNDMDFEKIDELYTSNVEKRYNFENKRTSVLLIRDFEYYRGSIIEAMDTARMNRDLMDMYYRSYGFSNYVDSVEERKNIEMDDDLFKEKYKDFKAKYELISYEEASKYKISYRQGIKYVDIDDMGEYISDKLSVNVDKVYVAKIHIKWSYGNKKYGYDESWWQNDTFKDYLEVQGGIMDETTMRRVSDYDDIIDAYDHIIYDVFIYESDGKQYIYNPNIIRNHYMGIKAD